jgi:hypothetical protein
MMGRTDRDQSSFFYEFQLDDMIPKGHLLRRIDVFVTAVLSDLHEQLGPFYSDIGRPSIDPELLIRMHLVGYPVDLSSFNMPDNDRQFSDLIKQLQKQMGVPDTGILTSDQFSRLAEASRDIDAPQIFVPPGKIVSMEGNLLLAVGTGTMDDLASPINKTRIVCIKAEGTCNVTEAAIVNRMLDLYDVASYEIQTWTPNRVTAIREHPCGTAMMSIDVNAKTVAVVVSAHKDLKFCTDKPQGTWSLVDGFPVGTLLGISREKHLN